MNYLGQAGFVFIYICLLVCRITQKLPDNVQDSSSFWRCKLAFSVLFGIQERTHQIWGPLRMYWFIFSLSLTLWGIFLWFLPKLYVNSFNNRGSLALWVEDWALRVLLVFNVIIYTVLLLLTCVKMPVMKHFSSQRSNYKSEQCVEKLSLCSCCVCSVTSTV